MKKRRRKHNLINFITIIVIFIIIVSFYMLNIFNKRALPIFTNYAEIEVKKIISLVLNNSIINEISDKIVMEDLFITTKDNKGNINSIDFNSKEVNNILIKVSTIAEQNLYYLRNGKIDLLSKYYSFNKYNKKKLEKGILYEIPSGIIFNNPILVNILPKIPVKLDIAENIFAKIDTDITPYGLNNALIKVNIKLVMDIKVLLPFLTTTTQFEMNIPLIMKIIEGNVPNYYLEGYLNTPTYTKKID